MKKSLIILFLSIGLMSPQTSKADMWGGDVVVLTKILIQTIQQLIQLKKLVDSANDEINLIRNINRGINDSLYLLKTIDPNIDPGLFKDWREISSAINQVERLYGTVKNVKDGKLYRLNDKSVAEAIVFNNKIFGEAKKVDQIGENIKDYSHQVSPGGAQKLTAQSMGVLLHVQNNKLRAQAKSLKLQAQSLARQNKLDKDRAKQITESVEEISSALKKQNEQEKFTLPRF